MVGVESKCGVMQPSWMIKVIEGEESNNFFLRGGGDNLKFVVGEGVAEKIMEDSSVRSRFPRLAFDNIG